MITAAFIMASSLFLLFEDNDAPHDATQLGGNNQASMVSQTHDFDNGTDEDWVVLDLVPGFWMISAQETMPPVAGSLSLGVELYDESRLGDDQAAPLLVLSSCASPTPVVGVGVNFQDRALFFLKIVECQGLTSGEYDVSLSPGKLSNTFDPVLIQGSVVINGTSVPVPGLYVLTNVNSSTIALPNGAFTLSINAFTPVILMADSPDYVSSVEFVGSQSPGATVSNVVIEVTAVVMGEDIFASGFEDGE